MELFATLPDLLDRLDWALDADELRIASGALEDASDLARGYGRAWEPATAPRLVRTLVLKAVVRYLRNPDGYTQSRAGDETVAWNDAAGTDAGTVYFTGEEQRLLKSLAGKTPGLVSVPVIGWVPQRNDPRLQLLGPSNYVPVQDSNEQFPFFTDEVEPW